MKKLLLLLFFSYSFALFSQVTNEGKPASWDLAKKSGMAAITLPQIDLLKIKAEDDINDKIQAKPYRVGILHEVNYGLDKGGTWTQLENGDRIWRIRFDSPDAVNLSLVFDEFFLPKGGKIYLYSDDRSDLLGAYTDVQNNEKQVLSTWFVKGDKIWMEYYEPKNVKGQGILNISDVVHCYRMGHTYQKGYYNDIQKSLNTSGICNHDVDCPIGTDFEAERDLLKKAVGFLFMPDPDNNQAFICSGTLINNTAEDKTPYFLTANHCSGTDPALYTMRFNWISPNPVCASGTNSTDAADNFTMTGSSLIAKNADSDFMLVEINNPIPSSWDVTFAGWDRTDTNPTFEVSMHHPDGDIMKISRDDTGAVKSSHSIGGPTAQTWDITTAGGGWELGVTEGGSSGGPLFDQNGRIIGQLFGGAAACAGIVDNGQIDFYGRFAISWDFGAIGATRLSNWLDPNGVGGNPNTLDALENVLAVNDEFLEQNISIFPNPTSGFVQIKIREWTSDMDYEVYNLLGQTLKSNRLQNNEILDLTDLPSDMYFIKITELETNRILVKKIVLNK